MDTRSAKTAAVLGEVPTRLGKSTTVQLASTRRAIHGPQRVLHFSRPHAKDRRERSLATASVASEKKGGAINLWERMFMGTKKDVEQPAVVTLSSDTFDSFLAESGERLCIVDFYTVWCGPCKIVDKHMTSMARKYTHVQFAKYDCEAEGNEELATALGISELPTVLVYRKGEQLRRYSGTSGIGEIMGMAEIWNDKAKQGQLESGNDSS